VKPVPRAFQLGLAVLVGLVVGFVWLAGSDEEATIRPSSPIDVTTDITPDAHVFGEPVVATVEALVDASQIDPNSVRVATDFAPYQPAADRTVERRKSGDTAVVTFRFPLHCLEEGCDTSGARGVAEFETGRIFYRFHDSPNDAFGALDWPPFEVASRVSADDVERIRWRAAETSLPDVGYRTDPTTTAALLLALAVAFMAGAAVLARRIWWGAPDEDAALVAAGPSETRLERALALARDASRNGDVPHRRRALERVARELSAVNRPELAAEARELAWSEEGSTEAEVETLARRAADGSALHEEVAR
jgi:hypothetical protein